jgi:hypothetical protein
MVMYGKKTVWIDRRRVVIDLEYERECRERQKEMTSWNYVMCPSLKRFLLQRPNQEGWDGHIENVAQVRHCAK